MAAGNGYAEYCCMGGVCICAPCVRQTIFGANRGTEKLMLPASTATCNQQQTKSANNQNPTTDNSERSRAISTEH